jgi:hypothetical protein
LPAAKPTSIHGRGWRNGKIGITVEIEDNRLASYTDSHLATLWHVAQANPADQFEDQAAGRLAERIGREIIRGWLKTAEAELWHHQGEHYYWNQLRKLATYTPGSTDAGSPEWHQGTWVPRPADKEE